MGNTPEEPRAPFGGAACSEPAGDPGGGKKPSPDDTDTRRIGIRSADPRPVAPGGHADVQEVPAPSVPPELRKSEDVEAAASADCVGLETQNVDGGIEVSDGADLLAEPSRTILEVLGRDQDACKGTERHSAIPKEVDPQVLRGRYCIEQKIALGSETVLYIGTGSHEKVCIKAVRNWLGRTIGPSHMKPNREKQNVSYSSRVRHIMNEFRIGRLLAQDAEMPVVRMYALRKVRQFGVEIGYDLIMEYLEGFDLSERRVLRGLSLADKINFFYQTARALQYVHQRGYLHLDMKPSNVMVTEGVVKLIDFGVSVDIGHQATSLSGTVGFLSPEQLARQFVDEGTDVFALGATFNYVLGGRFIRQDREALKSRQTKREADFHASQSETPLCSNVPEAADVPRLEDLIRGCTIPRRMKRIHSMSAVANELYWIARDLGIKLVEPY